MPVTLPFRSPMIVGLVALVWFTSMLLPDSGSALSGGNLVSADEPEEIPLWPKGAPGATGSEPKDTPTLILYPAAKNPSGTAIVVCPGGGYGGLAMGHEGHEIAQWLNEKGISAFICNYRHSGKGYGHPFPLIDAQRAIRLVRHHAKSWSLNPDRIGIIGFSAGGHLASCCATLKPMGGLDEDDPINQLNCRPDFAILCYPVIGFDKPYTHRGSQRNLLGSNPEQIWIKMYSTEEQVSSETCPTFLWHTAEDAGVPVENSIQFFLACRKHQVPAALHVFEKGRHGIGLGKDNETAKHWPDLCLGWLKQRGFLAP